MNLLELMRGILTSCGYACRGIAFALRSQRNFRIHFGVGVAVLAAAVALGFSRTERVLLILTVGLVILGELLNTALELALNLLEAQEHPVARAAKDVAAGGVFLAVLASIAVGLLLFGPRLWAAIYR